MSSIGSVRCPHCEGTFRLFASLAAPSAVVSVVERLHAAGAIGHVLAVEQITRVGRAEFCSKKRDANIVEARHMLWRRLRLRGDSYPRIAKMFDVDHTTVLAAIKGPRGR